MKKIFIILLSCLLVVSCSKDEKTQEEKEKDIFNMLIGKWQFSRMAWDIEFKEILTEEEFSEIIERPMQDCDKDNYIEFLSNSKVINKYGCEYEDELGFFEITFDREGPVLHVSGNAGLVITSHFMYGGYKSLISLNKHTFITDSSRKYRKYYIEFIRID